MTEARSDAQAADAILMVRPQRFGANPETGRFEPVQRTAASPGDAAEAVREFDGLVGRLLDAGVEIVVSRTTRRRRRSPTPASRTTG